MTPVQPELPSPALRHEVKAQLVLALPLALSHFGQMLMSLVDTAMLGRYSETALAGAGVASSLFFAITVFGIGLLLGLDTLVPQALGAGEPARARRLLTDGLRLAVLVGVPLTALCAGATLFLQAFGVEPAVAEQARAYMLWRLPSVVPLLLFNALRSYLQANDRTRVVVLAVVLGNVLNLGADAILVFGDASLTRVGLPPLGLPPLGAIGAAIATSIVTIAQVVVLALAARRGPAPSGARGSSLRAIAALGAPIGGHLAAEVGLFALTAVLAARLGVLTAAAHQVALTLSSLTFNLAVGVGAAAAIRVGRAVGGANHRAARVAGLVSLALGGIMAVFSVVFATFPEPLARLFTSDPDVVRAAAPLLRIAAVFQLADGAQAIAAGALRGAGDTHSTLTANLLGHYGVGMPVAIVLAFPAGFGAIGLWWGLCAGLSAVALLLILRFLHLTSRPIARR